MSDYDLTITEEGVFERVYREGEEPTLLPLVPWVVGSFDTGQVDVGGGETAILVVLRKLPGHDDEPFVFAMDLVTAKSMVVALMGNIGRAVMEET